MKSIIKKVSALLLVPMLVFGSGTMNVSAAENTVNVQLTVEYGQAEARTIIDMVNEFRSGDQAWHWNADDTTKTDLTGQLGNLTYDATLEKIAMQRAAELALNNSHTRANGESCNTAFGEFGYSGFTQGENIAAGYSSAEAVFVGWREDNENHSGQGHRRNMLNKNFTAIGIGHVYYNGTHYWTMELGIVNSAGDSGTDGTQTVNVETSNSYIQSLSTEETSTVAVGSTKDLPAVTATITAPDTWVQVGNGNPTGLITNPNWTVADSSIATISDGKVTGQAAGTTTLTVTAGNASATTTLEVTSDGQNNNGNDDNTNGQPGNGSGTTTPGNGNNTGSTTPGTTPGNGGNSGSTTPGTTPGNGGNTGSTTPGTTPGNGGNTGSTTPPTTPGNGDSTGSTTPGNGTASGNVPSDDNNNNNDSSNDNNSSNEDSSSNNNQESSSIIANATPSIVIPVTSVVGGVKTSTEGIYLATSCRGTIVSTPAADISRNYALTNGEKPYNKFYNFDAKKSSLAKTTIDSAAAGLKATVGPMLNIELGKMSGGKYSLLSSDGESIRLVLGIPKNFIQSDKTFAIIRVREGGAATVLKDLDTNPDTITFDTTGGAGVYAIVKY